MFRFRTPKRSDLPPALQTERAAATWYRQLPTSDAIGRQLHVIRLLDELCRCSARLQCESVAAVVHLDSLLGADRGQLIKQYVETVDNSRAVADRIWQAAYDISGAFIAAYRKLLDEALASPANAGWRRESPRLMARVVHFYGTDAKLRTLKGERWIPAKWGELHGLYRRAVELGIERVPLIAERTATATNARTVEQEYILVLLTHLVNTGTLAPSQIEWTLAQVRAWSRELTLEATPRSKSTFAVDLGGRKGFVLSADGAAGEMLRYLDTSALALQIERGMAALRRPAAAESASAGSLTRQRITILEKMRALVSPDTAPAVSRAPRAAVADDAEGVIGLARFCQQLAADDTRNAAFDAMASDTGHEPTGPLPVEGSMPRDGRAPKVAPEIHYGAATSWRVQNRSSSGIRITATGVISDGLALGALVAIRSRESDGWGLGVVRRMVKATTEKVDAGVSVIAPRFAVVVLHAKRQAREDMGFVVDGVDVSTIGERFHALYLPPPSRPKQPLAARSLVIPTPEYVDGRSIVVITGETVYTVVLRELIERHPEWSWVAIEIVGETSRG